MPSEPDDMNDPAFSERQLKQLNEKFAEQREDLSKLLGVVAETLAQKLEATFRAESKAHLAELDRRNSVLNEERDLRISRLETLPPRVAKLEATVFPPSPPAPPATPATRESSTPENRVRGRKPKNEND